MPDADRLRREFRAGANRHRGHAAPGAGRIRLAAGFAAAPDRRRPSTRPAMPPTTRGFATRTSPAPSRIGNIPTYGLPAASGASDSGYDSLNRTRKKPKLYPGQAKPKPPPGPGSPPPVDLDACRCGFRFRRRNPPTRRRSRRRWPAPWSASRRASGSRSTTIRSARSAITPAASWSSPRSNSAAATTPIPGRTDVPKGSPFYVVAPELLVVSDWERHALVADLRGSFTGYGNDFPPVNGVVSSAPVNVDQPFFTGHVDGRIDVSHDTHLLAQARLLVSTDNPGSPNVQAGLAEISGLRDLRRHLRHRPELQPAASFPAAPPSTAPSTRTRC